MYTGYAPFATQCVTIGAALFEEGKLFFGEFSVPKKSALFWYGVASISRLLKIIGLFCKRAL